MKTIPLFDLSGEYALIRQEIIRNISKIFNTQRFILGDYCQKIESEVAEYIGVGQGIGLASGSDALYLSLLALGVGPGDEVITTPFTFFATAGSISRTGATPVFADIEPRTFNLDPLKTQKAVSKKTKAIIPVHLFGLPADMTAFQNIAKKNSVYLIEDMAQAFGAEFKGKKAGSLSDVACLSFYPTKNFGAAGDGGMAVTRSQGLADKIRILRDHGSKKKYHHDVIGINSRLDEIQAAVLLAKMRLINKLNKLRQKHANFYAKAFQDLPLETPYVPKGSGHVYHLYSLLTKKRDALVEFLHKNGIGSGVYYPLALHLQPCYKNLGYKRGDFPVTERVVSEIFSIPAFPHMTGVERSRVVQQVRRFFK